MLSGASLIKAGFLLVVVGFFLIFAGSLLSALTAHDSSSDSEFAVGGFIGFIPFGFATDRRMLGLVILSSVIFFIFWLWFVFR